MQVNRESLNWLMENAGVIIRYRTAVELLGESDDTKVDLLRRNLLSDDLVKYWLGNLRPKFGTTDLHHSKPEAYENAMGKLYEFGLRKGMRVLDERTEPFRHWLAEQISLSKEERARLFYPTFYWQLTAAFLSMTGYSDDDAVNTVILKRLETVYPFTKKGDLSEVYIPQDSFPGFPKAFRRRPLINPDLYPNGEMKLPSIHDMNAFLHSTPIMGDPQLRRKVEVIVGFILKPEYQRLREGYGVIRDEKTGRYYAAGWSVHLPRYFEPDVQANRFGRFLLRLNTMSHSKRAREHPWFKRSLSLLEKYRTEDGLVTFPSKFMPKSKIGYWVLGRRMGLEANRRRKKSITSESTFRYLEIVMGNV